MWKEGQTDCQQCQKQPSPDGVLPRCKVSNQSVFKLESRNQNIDRLMHGQMDPLTATNFENNLA